MLALRSVALVAGSLGSAASVLGQAPLQFSSSPLPNVPFPIATDTVFGDLDADGDDDLALISSIGPKVYRNDGSGTFTDLTSTLPPLANDMRTAAFVDVDGDGRDEVLLTWNAQPRLFRSLPGGGWQELSGNLPSSLPTIHGAVAVDIDNDGDDDLACAGHWLSGGANQLLTNDGLGVFTASQPFPGTCFQILAVDVDQDGDKDVVVSRDGIALWRNDGNGTFSDATAASLPRGLGSPSAMDAGDVDGDGLVDLVLGNSAFGDVMLRNVGGGAFTLQPLFTPQPSAFTLTVALADLDGDHDLDWPRGTINYNQPTIWLNAGSGTFSDATWRLPIVPSIACQLRARDLDGDGDPDLVLTGLGAPPQVLWNRHRHAAFAAPPTLGGSLVIELASQPGYGTAGRTGIVGLSLARFDPLLPLPPLGNLGLDTTQAVLLGFSSFGANDGVQSFSLAVPAQPQFLGLPLYSQGLVEDQPGSSPRLTALCETRVR
jgi:hypothetical protein